MRKRSGAVRTAIGVIALTGACGCCCVSSVLIGTAGARLGNPRALAVHACAGLATQPRLQAGVAWYSPTSSYRGPLAGSPYAICVDIPVRSMPGRPHREWVFPP